MNTKLILSSMGVFGLLALPNAVLAAGSKKAGPSMQQVSSGAGKSGDRDWLISLPIVAERPQMRIHLEYNAAKVMGLALEAAAIGGTEELDKREIKATGNSMNVKGMQGSILMSRYTNESTLGGFFWTLGAGYQRWTADWRKKPETDESERTSLTDDRGFLHHRVEGSGVTGHARAGYRYVATEWPLAIGGHIGLRHMNSQVKNIEVSDSEEQKLHMTYSPVNDNESKSLKNRMMTTRDFAIDLGLSF